MNNELKKRIILNGIWVIKTIYYNLKREIWVNAPSFHKAWILIFLLLMWSLTILWRWRTLIRILRWRTLRILRWRIALCRISLTVPLCGRRITSWRISRLRISRRRISLRWITLLRRIPYKTTTSKLKKQETKIPKKKLKKELGTTYLEEEEHQRDVVDCDKTSSSLLCSYLRLFFLSL